MELHTSVLSPSGKRVRICAAELGVALDLDLLDFGKGDQRSPAYLSRNPMGKVPTLTDGDFVLWESPAIVLYLARKRGGGAIAPEEPRAEADMLRWMFFGASHVDPYFTALVIERLWKGRRGEPADEGLIASAQQSLARFLPIVEQQLEGRDYLTGHFSLADVTIGCTLELSPLVRVDLAPYPSVRAWLERLTARPSWRASSMGQVKPPGGPTRERFVHAYDGGDAPPWDIGKPQDDLVAVFEEKGITGSVLDLGCGTGENVLELARRGLDAWGLDVTPAAIAAAERKRAARGLTATFVLGDALDLAPLGRTFDTVLDCGLFHVIDDEERRRYVREVARALRPGGHHLMLGFATNTSGFGPRGYSPEELRAHFADGWREVFVRPTSFHTRAGMGAQAAWVSLFVHDGAKG